MLASSASRTKDSFAINVNLAKLEFKHADILAENLKGIQPNGLDIETLICQIASKKSLCNKSTNKFENTSMSNTLPNINHIKIRTLRLLDAM